MNSVCIMREIYKALAAYEQDFVRVHKVCLNEATVLCLLSDKKLTATEIAVGTGMTSSHTSKVLRSVEEKKLIGRVLGDKDKRQMFFGLTQRGKRNLAELQCGSVAIPDILKPIFEKQCHG